MSLKTRLQRLERKANVSMLQRCDLFADIERGVAYLRGEGPRPPDPPCPDWIDPAQWSRRLRRASCLEERLRGALPADGYLPDMDEDERSSVDHLFHLLTVELMGEGNDSGKDT